MGKILAVACFILVGLFVSVSARAQGGTNTGNIAGTAADSSGAVLPGASVEASSPALIERSRTTVTDANGLYKIVSLPPGTYSVTFTKEGFSTYRREGIELTTAFTATVNAAMQVGSVAQMMTVTGETPVIDTENSVVQQVLSNEVVNSLPLGKSAATYTQLVPGAVGVATNQDVGGAKGENAQGFRIHGSSANDYHQLRDGMFFGTLVAAGNFMSSSNPTAVQEVQIVTSGYSAEDWTGGGHVNIIPKNGGNELHGAFAWDYGNKALQSSNISPAIAARGVTTAPSLRSLYEVAGGVGGAIKKDKLWFFADARHWVSSSTQVNNYFNLNEALPFPNNLYYARDTLRPAYDSNFYTDGGLRLSWQASKRNKFTVNYITERNCNCFFNIGAGTLAPEATGDDYYMPNWRLQATWTFPVNNKLLLWAGGTAVVGNIARRATGSVPGSITVQDISANNYIYGVAGTGVGFTTSYGTNHFLDINENFTASYVAGAHALKFGYTELQGRGSRNAIFANNGITYQFACQAPVPGVPLNASNGLPTSVAAATVNSLTCGTPGQVLLPSRIIQFLNPFDYYIKLGSHTLFAQDQWRIKRLTVNLGLRFTMFNSGDQAQTVVAQPQYGIAARSYPEQNGVVNWKDLDPRFGVAYDVFGNGKTAIKGSIARSVLFEPLGGYTTLTNPGNVIVNNTSRAWKDLNGNFLPDGNLAVPGPTGGPGCNTTTAATAAATCELGAVANQAFYPGAGTPTATTYDSNVVKGFNNREYNWQMTASVQQQITPGVAVTFGFYRTWYGNLSVVRNTLSQAVGGLAAGTPVPASAYDQYCITQPTDKRLPGSGQQVCNLYDIQSPYFGKLNNVVQKASLYGGQSDVYTGIDSTVIARFHGLLLAGGLTAGHEVTDYCIQVNSPQDLKYTAYSTSLEYNNFNFGSVSQTGLFPCAINPPWYQNLQFKLQMIYTMPWQKIKLSISEQNLPSIPSQATLPFTTSAVTFLANSSGHIALSGNPTNRVDLITPQTLFEEGRNNQLDLRVAKEFKLRERLTVEPTVDFFNLFNASSILAKATTYNATPLGQPGAWNNVTTLLGARIIKFGVHVNF